MTENINYEQDFFSAARNGLKKLNPAEQDSLKSFLESKIQDGGFFANAEGKSDFYTSSFGICLSQLLGITKNNEATAQSLRKMETGEGFDFLHLSSLTRSWRFFTHDSLEVGHYSKIAENLEDNRTKDGLWNQAFGTHFGSIYGTYLAILSYQNLSQAIPEEGKIADALKNLISKDNAYGTDKGADNGSTPATAMATTLLHYMEEPYDFCVSWLLKQQHSDGGFRAVSQMPFSDVQSTVYTVQALKYAAPDELKKISSSIEKFLMSMKKENGFTGHCKDTYTDIENTYFALAGLGMID
jgi:prenyltransferase beta subunit